MEKASGDGGPGRTLVARKEERTDTADQHDIAHIKALLHDAAKMEQLGDISVAADASEIDTRGVGGRMIDLLQRVETLEQHLHGLVNHDAPYVAAPEKKTP